MSFKLPIDHVVILVRDLSAAGAAFEAAGFQVTPETRHSAAMGTANRCVILEGTYIELMGIVAETTANTIWRRLLEAGPGVRGLAFRSQNIEATAAELQARGISAEAVRHFSRETATGELRFSVTRIDPAETPGLQCLVCQHHTAELVWSPQTMRHPNGTSSLVEVALPQAEQLLPFASEGGVRTVSGLGRITIAGRALARHDLRSVCGVDIEVIAQ